MLKMPIARTLVLILTTMLLATSVQAATTINTVDTGGNSSGGESLALDASGFPVISYFANGDSDLRLVHCNDPACAGGDESIVTIDSAGSVGEDSELLLDSLGFPVIIYWDRDNENLKLVHCNDYNCAGEDESIVAVDSVGSQPPESSLALDGSGFPVISYRDATNGILKLAHCNDANCVGGDESIVTVDSSGDVGRYNTSLVLDSSGFPVISYRDGTNKDLKLVHCNDANCTGGDESIVIIDSATDVGNYSSLALDSSGFPVISYYDETNQDLKLVHCNDANCTGGDESIVTLDSTGNVGSRNSLVINSSGFPIVSYLDKTNIELKLVRCNDANCTGGDETIVTIENGYPGQQISLVRDDSGILALSYWDEVIRSGELRLVHCDEADCGAVDMDVQGNTVSITDGDSTPSITDHTDFGNVSVEGGAVTRIFTILNINGFYDLNLTDNPRVTIGGTHAADFTLTNDASTAVVAGGQTTFQITFDPSAAGLRQATISIANNDADENPYNFSIQGTGAWLIYLPIIQNN